jgi:hypothetical protein
MSYGYSPGYPPVSGYRYPPPPYGPPPYGPPVPGRRPAPPSVRVIATFHYLGATALLLLAVLITVIALGGRPYTEPYLPPGWPHQVGLALAGWYGFAGLIALVMGRKLHRGRQWARIFVLAVCVVAASATLYDGLAGDGGRVNVLAGLVCPVLYLVLLNTPAAREWFARRGY